MSERKTEKEHVSIGELLFLQYPGTVIFSGYGLAVEEGSKGKLIGLLMVDRPRPVDPAWLILLQDIFGEIQLVPMTKTGERGIVCKMQIEENSQKYLQKDLSYKASKIKNVLVPLLEHPPKPSFLLKWSEKMKVWESEILYMV